MMTENPTKTDMGHQGFTFESMLQKSLPCGLLAIDSRNRIVSINSEAERALRFTVADNPARSLSDLPLPIQAVVAEVRTSGQSVSDHQVTIDSPSGPVGLLLTAMPVALSPETPSIIIVLKDTAGTGRMDPSLRRLDRLASVGTLSASMAHEIKNALVAIKAFVDILLEKHPDAELAGIVRREIGRVDSIVSHMLKFSAPAQPAFCAIELHKILDHSLRLVQHRVGQKEIVFKKEFNAGEAGCNGNDHQLEQAFVNLLFNAVDAIDAEGTLTLSTDLVPEESPMVLREGDDSVRNSLRIRITDTGKGISPEHMGHIFEPFFTTKHNGTGLGLAVTRQIISEHRGSMHVESHPGKGTTFVILLPASAHPGPA